MTDRERLEVFGALDGTFEELRLNRFIAKRIGLQRWSVVFDQLVETCHGPKLVSVCGTGDTIREAITQALSGATPGWAS